MRMAAPVGQLWTHPMNGRPSQRSHLMGNEIGMCALADCSFASASETGAGAFCCAARLIPRMRLKMPGSTRARVPAAWLGKIFDHSEPASCDANGYGRYTFLSRMMVPFFACAASNLGVSIIAMLSQGHAIAQFAHP